MKFLLSLSAFILVLMTTVFAQKPVWEWAKEGTPTSTGKMIGYAVAADGNGSIYVAGKYSVTSTSFEDIFVAKYDELGGLIWFKSAGSSKNDAAVSITVDPAGYVYVTGYYSQYWFANPNDTAFFDDHALVSDGESDIFVAKYSPAGDVIWAKSFGGSSRDAGRSIVADSSGNLYLTGEFADIGASPPISGTATFGGFTLTSIGNADAFIAKLDTSANVIWAKSAGGMFEDGGWDIEVDHNGNLLLAGHFDGSITLDTIQVNSVNSGFVIGNFLLAKYNSDGDVLWAKTVGGSSSSSIGGTVDARKISLNASGDIYVVGTFEDCTLKFHNGFSLPGIQQSDLFLAKYSPLGDLTWALREGGNLEDYGWDIATSHDDNIYITGAFGSSLKIGNDSLVGSALNNVYVAKYESSGTPVWAISVAGLGNEFSYGITSTGSNSFYLTGLVEGAELVFGNDTVNHNGYANYFIAKASGPTNIIPIVEAFSDFSISPNPVSINQPVSIRRTKSIEVNLVLMNAVGRTLYRTIFTSLECSIETVNLNSGLYFVTLITANGVVTKKLIVQ